jgi:hypothetical protein
VRGRVVTLNEAIQVANFHSSQTVEAAYTRVIHKEERDIVKEPPRRFEASYGDYERTLARLRRLVTALHRANHLVTVAFRDE